MTMKRKKPIPISLYVHIPFCVRKCNYCDFLSAPASEEERRDYVSAVIRELDAVAKEVLDYEAGGLCSHEVSTIFFGGGTPSYLPLGEIQRVMAFIQEHFVVSENGEFTIECNPGTVTKEKLSEYQQAGLNRISFGLQSIHEQELEALGRIHTYEEFVRNYQLARELGFDNINIDLMSQIPYQTYASYAETLLEVLRLSPEHISAYSLILEEGTPFGDDPEWEKLLPNEAVDRKMYANTKNLLKVHGYERYEISNYAKPGYESRHNLCYWSDGMYLGVGIGAASYFHRERFTNIRDIEEYKLHAGNPALLRADRRTLDWQERMEEFMFLGLRKTKGISIEEFEHKFQKNFYQIYGAVTEHYASQGLMIYEKDRVALTDAGIDVSNMILADYLLD